MYGKRSFQKYHVLRNYFPKILILFGKRQNFLLTIFGNIEIKNKKSFRKSGDISLAPFSRLKFISCNQKYP